MADAATFLRRIESTLRRLNHQIQNERLSSQDAISRLRTLRRNILRMSRVFPHLIPTLTNHIDDLIYEINNTTLARPRRAYRCPRISTGRGASRYDIQRSQLAYLVENYFSVPRISRMLGVSQRTVFRRLEVMNISIRSTYSNIRDDHLLQEVRALHFQFPRAGYRTMASLLLQRGRPT